MNQEAYKVLKDQHIAKCGLISTLGKICHDQKVDHVKKINWKRVRPFTNEIIAECKKRITARAELLLTLAPVSDLAFMNKKIAYKNYQVELAVEYS